MPSALARAHLAAAPAPVGSSAEPLLTAARDKLLFTHRAAAPAAGAASLEDLDDESDDGDSFAN